MAFVRWDPFRDLVALQERMNRLFEESLSRSRQVEEGLARSKWTPLVDVYETEESLVLRADLAGMKEADIQVEVRENTLILRGERKPLAGVREESYHRIERPYGPFQRAFALPCNVCQDQVQASYCDGILEIVLPKASSPRMGRITMEVNLQ
ncbi:MAG: Hsp20/alpha crystallin family protein [Candidatus Tectomicrobia bacterium]|uniref:Hsp20/alpha crystallin family protein n=1 Tax=Tectimicrobiota bacterium TaxID=2528274 RepID=A0A932G1X5_UNCTE|nr:Hsp20/alpha crystallin family protein [Candidatus Tectomicrobia bacterium]